MDWTASTGSWHSQPWSPDGLCFKILIKVYSDAREQPLTQMTVSLSLVSYTVVFSALFFPSFDSTSWWYWDVVCNQWLLSYKKGNMYPYHYNRCLTTGLNLPEKRLSKTDHQTQSGRVCWHHILWSSLPTIAHERYTPGKRYQILDPKKTIAVVNSKTNKEQHDRRANFSTVGIPESMMILILMCWI